MEPLREFSHTVANLFAPDIIRLIWSYISLQYTSRLDHCWFVNSWWKITFGAQYVGLQRLLDKILVTDAETLEYLIVPTDVDASEELHLSYYTFCIRCNMEDIRLRTPCKLTGNDIEYHDDVAQQLATKKKKDLLMQNEIRALKKTLATMRTLTDAHKDNCDTEESEESEEERNSCSD
jgi:hypothetical protein